MASTKRPRAATRRATKAPKVVRTPNAPATPAADSPALEHIKQKIRALTAPPEPRAAQKSELEPELETADLEESLEGDEHG